MDYIYWHGHGDVLRQVLVQRASQVKSVHWGNGAGMKRVFVRRGISGGAEERSTSNILGNPIKIV